MNRQQQLSLAGGVGLGAGLMYLLDPQDGARRRSLARGKAVQALHAGSTALGKASRDLAHRSRKVRKVMMRANPRLLLSVVGGALCAAGAAVGTARLGLLGRNPKREWDGDMLPALDEEIEAVAVCDLLLP